MTSGSVWPIGEGGRGGPDGLRWKIIGVLLVVSLLPVALVGVGAWVVFSRLLLEKTLDLQRSAVRGHASAIDLYLAERLRALELTARNDSFEKLTSPGRIREILLVLDDTYPGAFVDLGVIDAHGSHLAYEGPYDLKDKSYQDAEWFRTVMTEGSYVSDVFLGYRQLPHCVMAIRRQDGQRRWILRATMNSETLDSLVETGPSGAGGEAFIINAEGRYQTPPREGQVLDFSGIRAQNLPLDTSIDRVREEGGITLQVATRINQNRWLLVVRQSEGEIMAPVRRAVALGGLVVLIAVGLVAGTTFLTTGYLTNQIDQARRQRDRMMGDLIRSAKLASVGELATGLAHEINNPLATISAEQTNIADLVGDGHPNAESVEAILSSVNRSKRQVQRCGSITTKMLQFGRMTDTDLRPTDVAPVLKEIVGLMGRQAQVRNIALDLQVEPDLPRALLDGNELQQVMTNLINNSIQAMDGAGSITVSARQVGPEIRISVRDTGRGIPEADRSRIFEPFFTTKPVGQGTGLGLSVCYGIVTGWGGSIDVESEVGKGTVMTIHLPL